MVQQLRPPPPPPPPPVLGPTDAIEATPPPPQTGATTRHYKAPPTISSRDGIRLVPPSRILAVSAPARAPPPPPPPPLQEEDSTSIQRHQAAAPAAPTPPPPPTAPADFTSQAAAVAENHEQGRETDVIEDVPVDDGAGTAASSQPQRGPAATAGSDDEVVIEGSRIDALGHHTEDSLGPPVGPEEDTQVAAVSLPGVLQGDPPARQWLQSTEGTVETTEVKLDEDAERTDVAAECAQDGQNALEQETQRKVVGGSNASTLPAWIVSTQTAAVPTRSIPEEPHAVRNDSSGILDGPKEEVIRSARLDQERPGILAASTSGCNTLRDGCLAWGSTPTPSSSSRPSRSLSALYSRRLPFAASMHPQNGQRFKGTLAYYHSEKGYGFIRSDDVEGKIYVHCSDFVDPMAPRPTNSQVEFTLNNPGEKQRALDVKVIGEGPAQNGNAATFTDRPLHTGRIRAFRHDKGFGFITTPQYGSDVFVSASDFVGELPPDLQALPSATPTGPEVSFTVRHATKGPRAMNVRITGPALPCQEEGQQYKMKSSNKHWQWNQTSGWRGGWIERPGSTVAAEEATPKGALLSGIEKALWNKHEFVMKRGDGYVWLSSVLHQGTFKDVPGLPLPTAAADGLVAPEVMSQVREALSDPWLKDIASRLELWDDGKAPPWIRQRRQARWYHSGWNSGGNTSNTAAATVLEPQVAVSVPAWAAQKNEVCAESTSWWKGDTSPSQLSQKADQADAGAGVPALLGRDFPDAVGEDTLVDPLSIQDPWKGNVEVDVLAETATEQSAMPPRTSTDADLGVPLVQDDEALPMLEPLAASVSLAAPLTEVHEPQAPSACQEDAVAEQAEECRNDTCESS